MRWLRSAVAFGVLFTIATPAFSQGVGVGIATTPSQEKPAAVVNEVRFTGLRRITSAAVAAQIKSRAGNQWDAARIEEDVRTLARLGWFESIRVETRASTPHFLLPSEASEQLALIFHLGEFPFLTKVEYSGSRLLSQKQIEKMLAEKKLAPPLGKPADPVALQRIAAAIRSSLNQLGHPGASVQIQREDKHNATVAVRFEIDDGPLLRVRAVNFEGNPQLSTKLLRQQMRSLAPWKPFASLRGKDAYTREAFEEDRQRILTYYQNHGYPEARIGSAQVLRIKEQSRRWLPWPQEVTKAGLHVSIPVQAGALYRFESIKASQALKEATERRHAKPFMFSEVEQGRPYSAHEIERLRRLWQACIQPGDSKGDALLYRAVEARQTQRDEKHSVGVVLDLSDSPPYIVQRIEFQGLHRFSDRYMRRRILLREGRPVDERALEAGLARLARTGYFKPIRKEDIHVQMDDLTHIAKVTIHVKEIGQQRATFSGGHAQSGSTLGLAYTVFDLLNREELLFAKFDGGPETLQVALGIAKEGIFGTRGSLAFSVFNNVLRPRFTHGLQGPFFNSRSEGISVPYTYALTKTDSLGINYTLSRTTSDEPLGTPPGLTSLPPIDLRTHISSSSLGAAWAHDTGSERILFSNSASGGFLGGEENMVHSSGEAARIFRDPIFAHENAWAFRTTFSAAGSYHGDMPVYARFFPGDEMVRGLRTGELGPYAMTANTTGSGNTTYSLAPAGANLVGAANAEYRIPLGAGTEATAFFDLGSGWLLPNWLGPTRPALLSATNGVLHGSTGIEFQWTVPGIQVPFRTYYALNVLRLNRSTRLSDKSLFQARNRFSAFGWGLGALF